jgi:hypothetical protein
MINHCWRKRSNLTGITWRLDLYIPDEDQVSAKLRGCLFKFDCVLISDAGSVGGVMPDITEKEMVNLIDRELTLYRVQK